MIGEDCTADDFAPAQGLSATPPTTFAFDASAPRAHTCVPTLGFADPTSGF